jgi:plastocyanin
VNHLNATGSRREGTVMFSASIRGVRLSFVAVLLAMMGLGLFAYSSTPVQAADTTVSIENFSFSPAAISVQAGDTVTWVNNDTVAHTATATDGSFDTGPIDPGSSASITFSTAGTFSYMCSIHPSMTGSVDVAAADDGGNGGEPIDLPNTGTGTTESGTSDVTILALLAVVAMILAGSSVLLSRKGAAKNSR